MTTRREKVLLELEDHFTKGVIAAAGATALLKKELNDLSGTSVQTSRSQAQVTKSTTESGAAAEKASKKTKEYTLEMAKADVAASRLRKALTDEAKAALDAEQGIERNNTALRKGDSDLNKFTGRVRLLTEAAVTLGPALIPIGAAGIPAVAGLTAGFGALAGSVGVALMAFTGLGDASKALDAYQLEPTVENLAKMQQEFDKLGPSGVQFVKFLDDLEPELKSLRELTRAGLFPGVEEGIDDLLSKLPEARRIIFDLATEMGRLASQAGDALSGDRFSGFFDYLETDAAPTLESFAHTIGNLGETFANLMVAFAPASRGFSGGLESMTDSLVRWSAGLSETQGFQDFLSYLRQTGPQVIELLGAIGKAFVGIITAAAPVGAAVLPALTALAKILGVIADSPIGPPLYTGVAALIAVNRAAILANASLSALGITAGATSTKLAGLGVAGTALALGLGTISDSQQIVDSLHRSGDAADATAVSYQQLADALQASNVGKYAADLDINVQRLAEDLVKNGESGEYASKVMQQLAGDSHGFGAMLNSLGGNIMPFYTANADKAYDANKDLGAIIEHNTGLLGSGVMAADGAASAARRLAKADNEAAEKAERAASSTRGLTDAMQEQTTAALGAFDAETQYREALKAAAAQAKKNEAGIRGNSEAALNNRAALSQLAGAWNNQSNAVKNNVGRWREARGAFIDTAVAMGVPIEKAKALANGMMQIPKSVVIRFNQNADPAIKAARLLKVAIENIPTAWHTSYSVHRLPTVSPMGSGVPVSAEDPTEILEEVAA